MTPGNPVAVASLAWLVTCGQASAAADAVAKEKEALQAGVEAVVYGLPLVRNSDGSLDTCIQRESPGKDREVDWLPAPEGEFNLTLRMYWPSGTPPSILDGTWKVPAVTRVN
jgi:hypothetical protein